MARKARQRFLDRRFASTRWFFNISDVDPRERAEQAARLLGLAQGASLEVMCHPGFGGELVILDSPEWKSALGGLPLGSYADL